MLSCGKLDVIHIRVLRTGQFGQVREVDLFEMFDFNAVGVVPHLAQHAPTRARIGFLLGHGARGRSFDNLHNITDRYLFAGPCRQPITPAAPFSRW